MHTSDITRALYGRIRALYGKFDVIKMGVVGVLAVIIIIMNYQREWKTVVFVKSFSGEKLRGIEGYVQPTLKEVSSHVTLDVGTNAITTTQDPHQIAERVLLNRAPSSTQLHPPPSSSFQPPLSSIQLHPAHFSLHPASATPSTIFEPKYCMYSGNFLKLRSKIKSCLF